MRTSVVVMLGDEQVVRVDHTNLSYPCLFGYIGNQRVERAELRLDAVPPDGALLVDALARGARLEGWFASAHSPETLAAFLNIAQSPFPLEAALASIPLERQVRTNMVLSMRPLSHDLPSYSITKPEATSAAKTHSAQSAVPSSAWMIAGAAIALTAMLRK